jgi:hypothetical protein
MISKELADLNDDKVDFPNFNGGKRPIGQINDTGENTRSDSQMSLMTLFSEDN